MHMSKQYFLLSMSHSSEFYWSLCHIMTVQFWHCFGLAWPHPFCNFTYSKWVCFLLCEGLISDAAWDVHSLWCNLLEVGHRAFVTIVSPTSVRLQSTERAQYMLKWKKLSLLQLQAEHITALYGACSCIHGCGSGRCNVIGSPCSFLLLLLPHLLLLAFGTGLGPPGVYHR